MFALQDVTNAPQLLLLVLAYWGDQLVVSLLSSESMSKGRVTILSQWLKSMATRRNCDGGILLYPPL